MGGAAAAEKAAANPTPNKPITKEMRDAEKQEVKEKRRQNLALASATTTAKSAGRWSRAAITVKDALGKAAAKNHRQRASARLKSGHYRSNLPETPPSPLLIMRNA